MQLFWCLRGSGFMVLQGQRLLLKPGHVAPLSREHGLREGIFSEGNILTTRTHPFWGMR